MGVEAGPPGRLPRLTATLAAAAPSCRRQPARATGGQVLAAFPPHGRQVKTGPPGPARYPPHGRASRTARQVLPSGHHAGIRRATVVMRVPGGHLTDLAPGAAVSWTRFTRGPNDDARRASRDGMTCARLGCTWQEQQDMERNSLAHRAIPRDIRPGTLVEVRPAVACASVGPRKFVRGAAVAAHARAMSGERRAIRHARGRQGTSGLPPGWAAGQHPRGTRSSLPAHGRRMNRRLRPPRGRPLPCNRIETEARLRGY
jgi:hypothetical protein